MIRRLPSCRRVAFPRLLIVGVAIAIGWPALCVLPAPSRAQEREPPAALEDLLREHVSSGAPGRLGATYDGYGVAERLPRSGAYLVDARLRTGGSLVRYPLKVRRDDAGGWSVEWSPEASFAKALVAFAGSDRLATHPDPPVASWAGEERLPGLPLVVGEEAVATPYGEVAFGKNAGVAPPQRLGKHVARWVDSAIERDRGTAGVDLMVTRDVPWRNVTRALLAAAGSGLFRVRCVVRSEKSGDLGGIPALAPVFEKGRTPAEESSFVVAVDQARPPRLRVRVGGRTLTREDDCGDETSLCPEGPEAFAEALPELVRSNFEQGPPSVAHVMVAVAGSVSFGDAISYTARVPGALGIPAERLYLGYVAPEKRRQRGGGER